MVMKVIKYSNSRKLKENEMFLNKIPEEHQIDGWISCDQYMPEDFELVELKEEILGKVIAAWAHGMKWEGLRVRPRTYRYWKFSKGVDACA